MSQYYMMASWGLEQDEPTQKPLDADLEEITGISNINFMLGREYKHHRLPNPIEMEWDDEIAGGGLYWSLEGKPSEGPRNEEGIRRKWAYIVCEPPLFHKDLVAAIQECGVNNLETYNVAITDHKSKNVCADYLAVNIVGLVKAANMSKSIAVTHNESGLIDTDFDSVVLDESAIKESKMFRLAESVNAIVIHRSIKEHLESKGGFELTFTEPENWIG